jgi:hypothetical protein
MNMLGNAHPTVLEQLQSALPRAAMSHGKTDKYCLPEVELGIRDSGFGIRDSGF